MQLYDISQEVFSCRVYPGDPAPEKRLLSSTASGDQYNLTAFSMCAHNGTHIDAPRHFIKDGKTVDMLPLSCFVGHCFVAHHSGQMSASDAAEIMAQAQSAGASHRILIAGDSVVTQQAAEVFAENKIAKGDDTANKLADNRGNCGPLYAEAEVTDKQGI